ncbi:MAG: flagellar biosynthesis protein FlhF [Desulfotomaculales bacterium]
MKIKRYVARDMQEAMRLVRDDLGPDAVIVATRKVREGGFWGLFAPPRLEVTAAVDEAPVAAGPAVHIPQALQPAPREGGAPRDGEGAAASVHRELSEVKTLLHRLLEREDGAGEDGFYRRWRHALLEMEIQAEVVDTLLSYLRQHVRTGGAEEDARARMLITNRIAELLTPAYQGAEPARVQVFVGPTGVGKTTTLAKLAARFALVQKKRVAVATIDTYRIGAVEQLKIYAEIIGIPIEVIFAPCDLAAALERHRDKDYILVDTAGRPSHNLEQVREVASFLEVIPEPRDVFLVLSCNTKMRDLERFANDFRMLKYSKLIFTKADETESLGCILNLAYRLAMPVLFVADGQNVPDDIKQVHPYRIAGLVLKGGRPYA